MFNREKDSKGYMTGFRVRRKAFPRFVTCVGIMSGVALLFQLAHADVWRCAEGYTNNPQGKTDCERAGALESCGSDGNRYLAPRRHGEIPNDVVCKPSGSSTSPLVDMSFANRAKFGDSSARDRLAALPSLGEKKFSKGERKFSGSKKESPTNATRESQLQDLFSCFGPDGDISGCSISGMGDFVDKTLRDINSILESAGR